MNKQKHLINALSELDQFIKDGVPSYARLRNFDLGPGKHSSVSHLSKYISHRVLFEYEIIENVLSQCSYKSAEKFIQEIFWRIYWKGWLENRPTVWQAFKNDVSLQEDEALNKAQNGHTGIACFDSWVEELRDHNYLHNHTRMWFASIWIFTLKLPWQCGARFFLQHLYDGDAASNTLSWRWVAGLQTKGKHYVAKASNIAKYTDNRFHTTQLAKTPLPLIEDSQFELEKNMPTASRPSKYRQLLVFENDLYLGDANHSYSDYEGVYVIYLETCHRSITLCPNVANFKKSLLMDFSESLGNAKYITSRDFISIASQLDGVDVVYPFVGECLDFINDVARNQGLAPNFVVRAQDTHCWQHAKKGFFNFKKHLASMIQETTLLAADSHT